jgi:hypothetical protein
MTAARYCSLAEAPGPAFAPGPAAGRLGALVGGRRMWVNGTDLHYCFYDDGSGDPNGEGPPLLRAGPPVLRPGRG